MNIELQKKIAYELTMEYIRQNNLLKESSEKTTAEKIQQIKNKYDEILKVVENNF